jgi:hypothetical protein
MRPYISSSIEQTASCGVEHARYSIACDAGSGCIGACARDSSREGASAHNFIVCRSCSVVIEQLSLVGPALRYRSLDVQVDTDWVLMLL